MAGLAKVSITVNIPVQQSQCGNRHIGRARLEAAVDTREHVIAQLFGAEPLR